VGAALLLCCREVAELAPSPLPCCYWRHPAAGVAGEEAWGLLLLLLLPLVQHVPLQERHPLAAVVPCHLLWPRLSHPGQHALALPPPLSLHPLRQPLQRHCR
jgi:hypothetical protein